MCAYRGYMQGMQQMVPTAISQVVEQVGKLAVGLTLAFMLLDAGPEYAAMGALIGVTVSELLALIYVMLSYRRRWPKIRARLERSVRREVEPVAARLIAIALPITIGASISLWPAWWIAPDHPHPAEAGLCQGDRPNRLLPHAHQCGYPHQYAWGAHHGPGHEPGACHFRL